jgi:hypothetical protein
MIKSRRKRWWGHVTRLRETRNAYKSLVGKPEGKDDLHDLGVDGSIKLKLILRRVWGMDWVHLIQNKGRLRLLVNTAMNLHIPFKTGYFLTSWVHCQLLKTESTARSYFQKVRTVTDKTCYSFTWLKWFWWNACWPGRSTVSTCWFFFFGS